MSLRQSALHCGNLGSRRCGLYVGFKEEVLCLHGSSGGIVCGTTDRQMMIG